MACKYCKNGKLLTEIEGLEPGDHSELIIKLILEDSYLSGDTIAMGLSNIKQVYLTDINICPVCGQILDDNTFVISDAEYVEGSEIKTFLTIDGAFNFLREEKYKSNLPTVEFLSKYNIHGSPKGMAELFYKLIKDKRIDMV